MGISPVILIVAALIVAFLVIWLLRSRRADSAAGHHVDSSVTAVGAASEAVRNMAEEVAQTVEEAMAAEVAASGAASDDVAAMARNSAAIMTSGSAVAGGITFTDIGVPAAVGEPDDLRRIKGLGPKLNDVLAGLGITRYDQIAGWTESDIALVDAQLGTFKGRIARDNWVEQAKYLASGDAAAFEAKFGKLNKPGQA